MVAGSSSASRRALLTSPAVLVPVGLALVLVVALIAGALLAGRASTAGRNAVGDTGPALVGVDLPADGQAGSPTVTLSPAAAAHPDAVAIRDLVQRSVDARNARDYAAWSATATAASVSAVSAQQFAQQSRSTRLGSVTLRRIDPVGPGTFVVPLGMVTTQDPADAPADVRVARLCWQISLTVSTERSVLRLAEGLPGSSLRVPC